MYVADVKVTQKTILLQALRKIFIRLTIGSFILFLIYLLVQRPDIKRSTHCSIWSRSQCFVLFDTFLLSVSPAIGVVDGMVIPSLYDGLLTQIVHHVDAMFNTFHRDAMPFVLPYCTRYDTRSWWTSQSHTNLSIFMDMSFNLMVLW